MRIWIYRVDKAKKLKEFKGDYTLLYNRGMSYPEYEKQKEILKEKANRPNFKLLPSHYLEVPYVK